MMAVLSNQYILDGQDSALVSKSQPSHILSWEEWEERQWKNFRNNTLPYSYSYFTVNWWRLSPIKSRLD